MRDSGTEAWKTAPSNGTRSVRSYYCQNWRADVVVVTDNTGTPIEWVRYSAYGVPFSYALADVNHDGVINGDDESAFWDAVNNNYALSDINFDGDHGTDADITAFYNSYNAASTGGRGVLSRSKTLNRIGYAGYQWDSVISGYHVRRRVEIPSLGIWTSEDPIGYSDSVSLYQYTTGSPMKWVDPSGTVIAGPCLMCCGPAPCCNTCKAASPSTPVDPVAYCKCSSLSISFSGASHFYPALGGQARLGPNPNTCSRIAPGTIGGGFAIEAHAAGSGNATACSFTRDKSDYVETNGAVFTDDRGLFFPDDPLAGTEDIQQAGNSWNYYNIDQPAICAPATSVYKHTKFVFTVINSDGTVTPTCRKDYECTFNVVGFGPPILVCN